jgi:HEAT repeat protein
MWRSLSVSCLVPLVLLASSAVRAADDEPTFRNKKLSEWIEQLQGSQARATRQTALLALGCSGSQREVWKWQIDQREASLIVITLIGPQKSREVFPALLGALRNDPDERIRALTAGYLGKLVAKVREDAKKKPEMTIKLEEVREGLVRALSGDPAPKVREASARALGRFEADATEAVSPLVASLRDPNEETQAAAAETLRILGKTLAVRDALPKLEEALKDPKTNTFARVQIAITIGIAAGKDTEVTLSVLTDLLKNEKAPEELRVKVAETLGQLVRRNTVPDLQAVLAAKGASAELRRACVAALDQFGPNAKPALAELLKAAREDKDKFIRTTAMHTIGGIGKDLGTDSRAVVKDLLMICNDPIFEVRLAAIETLGNLGAEALGEDLPTVLNKLNDLTRDSQRAVRETAADAVKKLKPTT